MRPPTPPPPPSPPCCPPLAQALALRRLRQCVHRTRRPADVRLGTRRPGLVAFGRGGTSFRHRVYPRVRTLAVPAGDHRLRARAHARPHEPDERDRTGDDAAIGGGCSGFVVGQAAGGAGVLPAVRWCCCRCVAPRARRRERKAAHLLEAHTAAQACLRQHGERLRRGHGTGQPRARQALHRPTHTPHRHTQRDAVV